MCTKIATIDGAADGSNRYVAINLVRIDFAVYIRDDLNDNER